MDDSTGTIACNHWHQSLKADYKPIELGTSVRCDGKIATFRGERQISVYDICMYLFSWLIGLYLVIHTLKDRPVKWSKSRTSTPSARYFIERRIQERVQVAIRNRTGPQTYYKTIPSWKQRKDCPGYGTGYEHVRWNFRKCVIILLPTSFPRRFFIYIL